MLEAGCAADSLGVTADSESRAWKVPVIVVAHNCSDWTAVRAAAAGARAVVLNNRYLRGKGAALRFGFERARDAGANAFLVVDADSVASRNLIAATRIAFERGAAATQCRYELELPCSRPATARERLRALAFRGINVLRARGRAGLRFSAGVFGNGFAVADDTLQKAPFTVDSICEDLEYHIRLVVAGLRVEWVDEAFVHAPLAPARSAQATQEARWEGGRFHVATRSTGKLMWAILKGNWRASEMLAEAWSLPISRGILALILTACLSVHWLHVYALAGAVLVVAYVMEAVFLGDNPWRDLAALAGAPVHILWKLAITPLVLRQSRVGAEWARTQREVHTP
jgi:cellulose synthase/poly-beta-1,6-N-acetylglucosamine synthase-like glycosyltransferase